MYLDGFSSGPFLGNFKPISLFHYALQTNVSKRNQIQHMRNYYVAVTIQCPDLSPGLI